MRWIHPGDLKERARRERAVKSVERLSEHSRDLKKLKEGDMDFVQNQTEMEKKLGQSWKTMETTDMRYESMVQEE